MQPVWLAAIWAVLSALGSVMLVFRAKAGGDEDLVARDLKHALLRLKMPLSEMKIGSSDREHMDLSTLLSVNWHSFSETVSSAGNISIFCYTVFEIIGKYRARLTLKQDQFESRELSEKSTPEDIRKELERLFDALKDRHIK